MMVSIRLLTGVAALSALPSTLTAQTIDTVTLRDDVALTITVDDGGASQTLETSGQPLATANTITRALVITDDAGETAAAVFLLHDETEDCAPSPLIVGTRDGLAQSTGRLGTPCASYDVTVGTGRAVFLNRPDFHRLGDIFSYELDRGTQTIGAVAYAPQPDWTWDLLRRQESASAQDVLGHDLFAYAPVYDALVNLWGQDLFIYAQHLSTHGATERLGRFFYQPGCILSQCAFAIGLLAVDPQNEQVYSAYLNEGAPDVRPPLETWDEEATALYNAWRAGELR